MRVSVTALAASALLAVASPLFAAEKYTLDASHSQVLFSYDHLGFSTTWGMFSGFEGEILFDQADPAASSVSVSIPVKSMFTGWEKRDAHLFSADFFGAADGDLMTFTSTNIEVTGETTANITGDLTVQGATVPVTLEAQLNKADTHPMAKTEWLGFNATTTLKRSDFGIDRAVPFVGDEIAVQISIEAQKAE